MITVRLSIGGVNEEYHLYYTRAPRRYDYNYVIPLYAENPNCDTTVQDRYILIPQEHVAYQCARYRSGLFETRPSDDMPAEQIEGILWERIGKLS